MSISIFSRTHVSNNTEQKRSSLSWERSGCSLSNSGCQTSSNNNMVASRKTGTFRQYITFYLIPKSFMFRYTFHSFMHYIQYAIPDIVLIIENTEDGPGDYYKLFLFSMYLLLFYIFEYISNLTQWSSLYQTSLL